MAVNKTDSTARKDPKPNPKKKTGAQETESNPKDKTKSQKPDHTRETKESPSQNTDNRKESIKGSTQEAAGSLQKASVDSVAGATKRHKSPPRTQAKSEEVQMTGTTITEKAPASGTTNSNPPAVTKENATSGGTGAKTSPPTSQATTTASTTTSGVTQSTSSTNSTPPEETALDAIPAEEPAATPYEPTEEEYARALESAQPIANTIANDRKLGIERANVIVRQAFRESEGDMDTTNNKLNAFNEAAKANRKQVINGVLDQKFLLDETTSFLNNPTTNQLHKDRRLSGARVGAVVKMAYDEATGDMDATGLKLNTFNRIAEGSRKEVINGVLDTGLSLGEVTTVLGSPVPNQLYKDRHLSGETVGTVVKMAYDEAQGDLQATKAKLSNFDHAAVNHNKEVINGVLDSGFSQSFDEITAILNNQATHRLHKNLHLSGETIGNVVKMAYDEAAGNMDATSVKLNAFNQATTGYNAEVVDGMLDSGFTQSLDEVTTILNNPVTNQLHKDRHLSGATVGTVVKMAYDEAQGDLNATNDNIATFNQAAVNNARDLITGILDKDFQFDTINTALGNPDLQSINGHIDMGVEHTVKLVGLAYKLSVAEAKAAEHDDDRTYINDRMSLHITKFKEWAEDWTVAEAKTEKLKRRIDALIEGELYNTPLYPHEKPEKPEGLVPYDSEEHKTFDELLEEIASGPGGAGTDGSAASGPTNPSPPKEPAPDTRPAEEPAPAFPEPTEQEYARALEAAQPIANTIAKDRKLGTERANAIVRQAFKESRGDMNATTDKLNAFNHAATTNRKDVVNSVLDQEFLLDETTSILNNPATNQLHKDRHLSGGRVGTVAKLAYDGAQKDINVTNDNITAFNQVAVNNSRDLIAGILDKNFQFDTISTALGNPDLQSINSHIDVGPEHTVKLVGLAYKLATAEAKGSGQGDDRNYINDRMSLHITKFKEWAQDWTVNKAKPDRLRRRIDALIEGELYNTLLYPENIEKPKPTTVVPYDSEEHKTFDQMLEEVASGSATHPW